MTMETETEAKTEITYKLCLVQETQRSGDQTLSFYRLRHINGKIDPTHFDSPYLSSAFFHGGALTEAKVREELAEWQEALDRGPVAVCEKHKDTWTVLE